MKTQHRSLLDLQVNFAGLCMNLWQKNCERQCVMLREGRELNVSFPRVLCVCTCVCVSQHIY